MNKKYNAMEIPEELDFMVKKTIQQNKNSRKLITSIASTAAALLIFTTSLNVSSTFADTMHQIPVIKNVASFLTFRSYETESDEIQGDVTVPEINMDETKLDDYINEMITEKVETLLAEAQLRAEEYKDAYLSTGGTEEGYKNKNMTVDVNYEVFMEDDNYLSFRVYTHETLAAVYAENLYFTVDLKAKKLLTLEDLLGKKYVNVMTENVLKAIEEDAKANPDKYFDDYQSPEFQVREDIDFYLKDNKLFIVFQKYELAPGAHGRLEFEIPMK